MQNKDEALYGLREGYKNSADELVEIALKSKGNPKILDTFIFPIMFSYRHCLEPAGGRGEGYSLVTGAVCQRLAEYLPSFSTKEICICADNVKG